MQYAIGLGHAECEKVLRDFDAKEKAAAAKVRAAELEVAEAKLEVEARRIGGRAPLRCWVSPQPQHHRWLGAHRAALSFPSDAALPVPTILLF